MAIPSGIFMAPPATPAINLITDNPVVAGYRAEDEFLRKQAEARQRQAAADQQMVMTDLRMDAGRFDLAERQRKADEALALDAALRRSLGQPNMGTDPVTGIDDDTTIYPSASTSARSPDTHGPVDPSAVQSVPLPAPVNGGDAAYLAEQRRRESGGRLDAKNPRSSAFGPDQFINSTWLSVLPEVERRLGQDFSGLTREQKLALRSDPDISAAASFVLKDQNRGIVERGVGRPVGDPELHLAHFLGGQGAVQMMRAPPDDEARMHATPEAVAANPEAFAPGRKVRDLLASYKVGGPVTAPPVAAAPAMGRDSTGGGDDQTLPAWGRPAGDPIMGTDPRLRAAQRALAETPGGGAALLKMVEGEAAGAQNAKMKVFELAARGQTETAIQLAQQLGMKINPAMLRDQGASAKVWEVLRTVGAQDPAYAISVIKNLRPGGSVADAVRATDGAPERRTYGGRSGSGIDRPVIRSVPGKGLYRINPAGGEPELIVPVGEQSSPYKMHARARELATREAGQQITNPGAAWIDQRTAEIFEEFQRAGSAAPAAGASPAAPAAPAAPAPVAPGQMVPGGAAATGGAADIFSKAQAAIRGGADPVAVNKRAMDMFGVDLSTAAPPTEMPASAPPPAVPPPDPSPFGMMVP